MCKNVLKCEQFSYDYLLCFVVVIFCDLGVLSGPPHHPHPWSQCQSSHPGENMENNSFSINFCVIYKNKKLVPKWLRGFIKPVSYCYKYIYIYILIVFSKLYIYNTYLLINSYPKYWFASIMHIPTCLHNEEDSAVQNYQAQSTVQAQSLLVGFDDFQAFYMIVLIPSVYL